MAEEQTEAQRSPTIFPLSLSNPPPPPLKGCSVDYSEGSNVSAVKSVTQGHCCCQEAASVPSTPPSGYVMFANSWGSTWEPQFPGHIRAALPLFNWELPNQRSPPHLSLWSQHLDQPWGVAGVNPIHSSLLPVMENPFQGNIVEYLSRPLSYLCQLSPPMSCSTRA